MTRRSNRTRAFAPDPAAPGRPCDIPGCDELAGYRAPKSPTSLADYHWFCLEHVRAYNAKWDYYRGMTPGQIESELRADVTGRRPTWPLGRNGGGLEAEFGADPLDVLSEARLNRAKKYRDKFTRDATPADLKDALHQLALAWPVTLAEVKTRYKELAKRHHPDANGGDRTSEERLKVINLAYATLKTRLNEDRLAEERMEAAG